ncbi:glycoside hydrolase family protein [Venturia nashicola]|nr:glycoside hydrolase family protein [Venturia nashicola]
MVDFPDPAILQVGNTWYAYATNNNGTNVQLATVPREGFDGRWTQRVGYDVLPKLPSWVLQNKSDVWAPGVVETAPNNYVMYFSATLAKEPKFHCLGTAVASAPDGIFAPDPEPFACDTSIGGAIDASGFVDPVSKKRFVTYKVDGNSLGSGGSCNNGFWPRKNTPLVLQEVAADGRTKVGPVINLLNREDVDGPSIEAPSISYIKEKYFLFYSSNCWDSGFYDVKFATATSVRGPYKKGGQLLISPNLGLINPGGADATTDGKFVTFHAGPPGKRFMYTGRMDFDGDNTVNICTNGGCRSAETDGEGHEGHDEY